MTLEQAREAIAALAQRVDPRPGEVHLSLEGALASITLDNPDARNAITLQMMGQLADAVMALRSWPGAAVVLGANGPFFCSGGHLGQVRRAVGDGEQAHRMARAMGAVLDGLLALPQVSLCALDGPAIGGGAELCTATDFRVAGPSAVVDFAHARLGIAPGWGGTSRLALHLGSRAALRILAQGRPLSAERCLGLGLVDELGPSASAAADSLLEPMLAHSPQALRAVKAQVVAGRAGDPEAEARAFAAVWGGPAHQAALDRLKAAR